MKLRSRKTINKIIEKPITTSNVTKEPFSNQFIRLYYSIKNQFDYCDFHNQPSYDTKYTLCTLYTAFKLFINKEYGNEEYFLDALSAKTLLPTRTLPLESTCYICGGHDNNPTIFCSHNHDVHLECYFEQIIGDIKPMYRTFTISNDKQRCDYCNDYFVICYNYS